MLNEPRREKPTIWILTRLDTNWTVHAQKMAGDWKFGILEEEELYYLCSKNKGVDQLHSYDLRL